MKNFFSGFLSTSLLLAFLFTFAFQNITAALQLSSDHTAELLAGKHVKTVHTPGSQGTTSDENPMENEDKDEKEKETETKIEASLPFVFCTQSLLSFNYSEASLMKMGAGKCSPSSQPPLYLVIRTFRI